MNSSLVAVHDGDASAPPSPNDGPIPSSNGTKSKLLMIGCALALSFVGALLSVSEDTETALVEQRSLARKPKVFAPQPFAFDAGFGDNMVLQHGKNTHAAIYGFLGPTCEGVQLDLYKASPDNPLEYVVYSTTDAAINATHQPFNQGPEDDRWGPRPCSESMSNNNCKPFNPWNQALSTWKVLLPPQVEVGGNYTLEATCIGEDDFTTIQLRNITFGDVWYCSGQSNMWLPLQYTFGKNDTANAILGGKYHNIRVMAGDSEKEPYGHSEWNYAKYGSADGTNPWKTSLQALDHQDLDRSSLMKFSGACWHFAQKLTEMGVDHPIGLINTAIGGHRIQEFMDNRTLAQCRNRTWAGKGNQEDNVWWESGRYATQVLPFVDMTVKGFLWYQGENNMYEVKGNSEHDVGYGCEMQALIQSWRKVWSETPDTTSPTAPFGVVTLAHGGSEGGPDMGAMRQAQTANYGILPPPHHPIIVRDDVAFMMVEEEIGLTNTFLAQAYDLRDEWDADTGPCFQQKCCHVQNVQYNKVEYDPNVCSDEMHEKCNNGGACQQALIVPYYMGGIHPRTKKQVGERLAKAAYNLFFGGQEAYTGPTLEGCSVKQEANNSTILEIQFNSTLLRGDILAEPEYPPKVITNPVRGFTAGGSQLYVQIDASLFCMEEFLVLEGSGELRREGTKYTCPLWAGGTGEQRSIPKNGAYDGGWVEVPFTRKDDNTIAADLSGFPSGFTPTAVKYAWGGMDCCDFRDPELFVTKPCTAKCPIYTLQGQLPANPFKAKIVDGRCECIAPQVCSDQALDAGVHL